MKKILLSIACCCMLAFVGIFAVSCGDDDPKAVEAVQAKNVPAYYHITDTVNLDNVTLTVTYDNEKTETLTVKEIDVPIEEAKEDTQFVIYTSGLSAMESGNLTIGDYALTVSVVGFEGSWNIGTINVSDSMSLIYDLTYFGEPEFVTTYKNNIASLVHEDSFYNTTESYTVGDDNAFKFKPEMTLLEKDTSAIYEPENFDVDVKVYLVDESSETDVTGNEDYYTYSNFEFDFTDTAIGNTFRIEMLPSDFDGLLDGTTITPVTFTFEVQDGWNAYTAEDLARINLLSDADMTGYSRIQSQKIFYNSNTQQYEKRYTYQIWKDWLLEKGYTESELTDINGIYFHKNITIETTDIPDDFFITEQESSKYAGSLRDFSLLYIHYLDDNFTLNGNYFLVDASNIPLGFSNTSYSGYIYPENITRYYPGHSTLFSFAGKNDNTSTATATFKNLNAIGNTGDVVTIDDDATQEEKNDVLSAMGGIILLKSMHGTTYVENNIAKEFLIAWFAESSQENEKGNMYIDQVKTYDCFNSGIFSYASDNNTVANSEFKRFGGPVMLLVSESANGTVERYTGFEVDSNTILESYIQGTEAWFIAQGADSIATSLFDIDTALSLMLNNSMLFQIEGQDGDYANMKCLIMDSDYLASDQPIFGDFTYGDVTNDNQMFSTYNNQIINSVLEQTGRRAPIFMSNGGDIAYFNGSSFVFVTQSQSFSGNLLYILYPIGGTMAGVVLELQQLSQTA